eukprot:2430652-Karenia_brevis.AAC.1
MSRIHQAKKDVLLSIIEYLRIPKSERKTRSKKDCITTILLHRGLGEYLSEILAKCNASDKKKSEQRSAEDIDYDNTGEDSSAQLKKQLDEDEELFAIHDLIQDKEVGSSIYNAIEDKALSDYDNESGGGSDDENDTDGDDDNTAEPCGNGEHNDNDDNTSEQCGK